jgi:hypothetical protein
MDLSKKSRGGVVSDSFSLDEIGVVLAMLWNNCRLEF